ncbi:MAG TPA: hypothetical protein VFA30_09405 [Gaiellaceae bacterium]|nr:hypothetical protein [Gaiellaceae bacterium]
MHTTHIIDLVLALAVVAALAGVCRAAFLLAGRSRLPEGIRGERDERLAA